MRLAQVDNGVVTNVIEVDPANIPDWAADWPEAGGAGPGWSYDGETFSPPPEPEPTPADVDAERDRRIDGGFEFAGVRYQTRPGDRENIAGASIAALGAIGAGAQPGDYRWHGGDSDFVWIAEDNSMTPMDAPTMFSFGQSAMAHKQSLIFAARALKDMDPIPADFDDDQYWDQALTA